MKSYSQFVTESNEVSTTLIEEVYQDLLDSGYTEEQISESYYYYENLVEEGLITENPLAALGKLGGRVLPGVGAGLYGYDAIQRARKGDYGGAALQGLGAGLSLVPGVGTLGALAPAAINMATDAMGLTGNKSKGQPGYKPPTPAAASKPGGGSPAPVRSTTSTTKKKPNSTVLALKGGVQGRLDKATGKFTAGNFSDAEKSRYTAAGGKIPSAKPAPSASITGNKASNFMSSGGSKAAAGTGAIKATGSAAGKALAAPVPSKSITGNKASSFMNPGAGKALAASPKPQMTAAGNKVSDLAALRAKAKNDTMARAKTQVSTPKMVGSARM